MSIYRSPDPEPVRVNTTNPDDRRRDGRSCGPGLAGMNAWKARPARSSSPHVADDDYDLRGWLREAESAELWELDPE
ncbi:MAG: hypothetical protein ACOC5K_05175 [Chloroflexota bacterium]